MMTDQPNKPMRLSQNTYRKLQARSATLYARELERWNDRLAPFQLARSSRIDQPE